VLEIPSFPGAYTGSPLLCTSHPQARPQKEREHSLVRLAGNGGCRVLATRPARQTRAPAWACGPGRARCPAPVAGQPNWRLDESAHAAAATRPASSPAPPRSTPPDAHRPPQQQLLSQQQTGPHTEDSPSAAARSMPSATNRILPTPASPPPPPPPAAAHSRRALRSASWPHRAAHPGGRGATCRAARPLPHRRWTVPCDGPRHAASA
jgi:hypothetical protein